MDDAGGLGLLAVQMVGVRRVGGSGVASSLATLYTITASKAEILVKVGSFAESKCASAFPQYPGTLVRVCR